MSVLLIGSEKFRGFVHRLARNPAILEVRITVSETAALRFLMPRRDLSASGGGKQSLQLLRHNPSLYFLLILFYLCLPVKSLGDPDHACAKIKPVLVSIDANPPRPKWLRVHAPLGENYRELKSLMGRLQLHTVCESAACPNVGECWNQRTATFMILGNVCTRRCGFCAVQKGGPLPVDYDEPRRVAEAVAAMGLKYAVITSVNRDDRKDGGAELFALTIAAIRGGVPGCKVEVLVPDFQGSHEAMETTMRAGPDVLNHNIETVPRLYRQVRLGARYERSLDMLAYAGSIGHGIPTKSGIMLGLGENQDEVVQAMRDLRAHGVAILTIGQYLRPSRKHLPVIRYVPAAEFDEYRRIGYEMGFRHVVSGPLVRSSYHAAESSGMTPGNPQPG
jgi:lipoic acid synthetase